MLLSVSAKKLSLHTIMCKHKNIKRWLLTLLASFLMYEVLWSVIEIQFDDASIDAEEMAWDFAQCLLFTSVVFLVNWFFATFRGGRYAGKVVEIATLLVVNAAVIFVTDKVINERDTEDVDFWGVIDIYVICIICSLLSIINILRSHHKQILSMKQEQMRLRLNLLQQQLSPHFMFNSLSTLQGVIAVDPQMAEEYLGNLSDAMRYITENVGRDKVVLSSAIDFIDSYMKMLQVRFPNHFDFKIDAGCMPADACIVPVSLQIAVENAIKHNSHSANRPLEIAITTKQDSVEVRNKKQPLSCDSGIGVGLKNLDERYILLMGRGIHTCETDDYYSIEIPLIYESTDS